MGFRVLIYVGDDMWVWLWGYLAIKIFKMVDWGRYVGVVGCVGEVWCLPFANLRAGCGCGTE